MAGTWLPVKATPSVTAPLRRSSPLEPEPVSLASAAPLPVRPASSPFYSFTFSVRPLDCGTCVLKKTGFFS